MEKLRDEVKELEVKFNRAILESSNQNFREEIYSVISQVIQFMENTSKEVKAKIRSQATLICGPTGAGKSVIMNDFVKENNLIVTQNVNGKLVLKAKDSVSTIGKGKGSTTLFPGACQYQHMKGIFLDCAGEGDTGGVVVKAICALIKSIMASNVQEAKILLVFPQASLDQEGGYGENFKKTLDVNAQFLNDIAYFKDSIAVVISQATTRKNTHEIVKKTIKTILEEHSNLDNYKDVVQHLLQCEEKLAFSRISIFSKPSEDAQPETPYTPPSWNSGQRERIMNMVEKLPFRRVPRNNFFNVSFDNDVKIQMESGLEIVKMKAGKLIGDWLMKVISPKLTIFAVELSPFAKFISELNSGKLTPNLKLFVKFLQWNNYFKIDIIPGDIQKLDNEMIFLSQFITERRQYSDSEHPIKEDWLAIAKKLSPQMGAILKNIQDEVKELVNLPGNNFGKFEGSNFPIFQFARTITTKGTSQYSLDISNNFRELHQQYLKKTQFEKLYGNVNEYPKDQYIQKYLGTERVQDGYKTQKYEQRVIAPGKTAALHLLTFGIGTFGRGLITGDSDNIAVWQTKTSYRDVPNYVDKPINETVKTTIFDEQRYQQDIAKIDTNITNLKKEIQGSIARFPKGILHGEKETLKWADSFEKTLCDNPNLFHKACFHEKDNDFKDLKQKWLDAEYGAYFALNPNKTLELLSLEAIIKKCDV